VALSECEVDIESEVLRWEKCIMNHIEIPSHVDVYLHYIGMKKGSIIKFCMNFY